jgi:hypothetical protein
VRPRLAVSLGRSPTSAPKPRVRQRASPRARPAFAADRPCARPRAALLAAPSAVKPHPAARAAHHPPEASRHLASTSPPVRRSATTTSGWSAIYGAPRCPPGTTIAAPRPPPPRAPIKGAEERPRCPHNLQHHLAPRLPAPSTTATHATTGHRPHRGPASSPRPNPR